MGNNNSSKKDRGSSLYSRPPSKRWRKNAKPRDYWKGRLLCFEFVTTVQEDIFKNCYPSCRYDLL